MNYQRAALRALVSLESRLRCERGQTTAEYALVVLGAAAVAMLLIAWATSTGKVSTMLNKVVDSVSDRIA